MAAAILFSMSQAPVASAQLRLAADTPKSDAGCICMELYLPVCGAGPDGTTKTYSNACYAKCAKATVIHKGKC
ncbi:MAG: Kazal-type serine protease inhibitor family protein [Methylovirgula sp.]